VVNFLRARLVARLPILLIYFAVISIFYYRAHSEWEWPWLSALERASYDWRVRHWNSATPDARIAIVDVDEATLLETGGWPWRRDRMAYLVQQLTTTYQAGLIALDMTFPQPDPQALPNVLKTLTQAGKAPAWLQQVPPKELKKWQTDEQLAAVLKNSRVILGMALFTATAPIRLGELPKPLFSLAELNSVPLTATSSNSYLANLPELAGAALTTANISVIPDTDGTVRAVPLLFPYEGQLYETLALAAARAFLKIPELTPRVATLGEYQRLEALILGNRAIPLDMGLQTLVPFPARGKRFERYSAADILRGQVDTNALKDKVIFVGSSAPSLHDTHPTPVHAAYPGVEIHAVLCSGIMQNHLLHIPPYAHGAEIAFILAIGLTFALLLLPAWIPLLATVSIAVALAVVLAWSNLVFWQKGIVLPLVPPLFTTATLLLCAVFWRMLWEERRPQTLLNIFRHRLARDRLHGLHFMPDMRQFLAGREQEATLVIVHVSNYPPPGQPPAATQQQTQAFIARFVSIARAHHGVVGDWHHGALTLYWNLPVYQAFHQEQALRAVWDMLHGMVEFYAECDKKQWIPFKAVIGAHTGMIQTGGIARLGGFWTGGEARAQLLELPTLATRYGVNNIVTNTVLKRIAERWVTRELDWIGENHLALHQLLGPERTFPPEQRHELDEYHEALATYRAQQWDTALEQFTRLCRAYPHDALYEWHWQRCQMQSAVQSAADTGA